MKAASVWQRRADRARALADTYPATREIFSFYAGLASWQAEAAPRVKGFQNLAEVAPSLLEWVSREGTPALAAAARDLDTATLDSVLRQYWEEPGDVTANEFFARSLLELYAAILPEGIDCPWCDLSPQAGLLRSQGDGLALERVCGLCFRTRAQPRGQCPHCGDSAEAPAAYTTPDLSHLRLSACDACHGYYVLVDLEKEPRAIPEVDELAALPLDLWAVERGYRKLQPNIVGV